MLQGSPQAFRVVAGVRQACALFVAVVADAEAIVFFGWLVGW